MVIPPFIVCPRCGRATYHPDDIRHEYCGFCRAFHKELKPQQLRGDVSGVFVDRPQFAIPPDQVQRIHDLFNAFLLGEIKLRNFEPSSDKFFTATHDVLCWLLGHDHNCHFFDNLMRLEAEMERAGISCVDAGSLQQRRTP